MFETDDLDEMDIAQTFLSVGRNEVGDDVTSNPPITTSLSSDFCQYVAVQEIPRFGIHCYFATSTEGIDKWNLPPGRRVLDADIANPLAWERCMAKISACIGPINKH
uniref:Zinc finger CCCH domain-containing protein 7A n=1 Tax=Lygus hesperus TaxID=30085 RepID=A0A0A9X7R9_LYGHE